MVLELRTQSSLCGLECFSCDIRMVRLFSSNWNLYILQSLSSVCLQLYSDLLSLQHLRKCDEVCSPKICSHVHIEEYTHTFAE